MEDLGYFDVEFGLLIVIDPCETGYELPVGQPLQVSNGKWRGTVTRGIDRKTITALIVTKADVAFRDDLVIIEYGKVTVSSGQLGIFDFRYYRDDRFVPPLPKIFDEFGEIFYNHCCIKTLSSRGCGLFPFGIVTTTGYGDGVYDIFLLKDEEEIVGIRVNFAPEITDTITDIFHEKGLVIDVDDSFDNEEFEAFFNNIFSDAIEVEDSEDDEYVDFDTEDDL